MFQFHPVTDRIVHIDLLKVIDGKPVKVNLPLRSQGTAAGVIAGGRMETLSVVYQYKVFLKTFLKLLTQTYLRLTSVITYV